MKTEITSVGGTLLDKKSNFKLKLESNNPDDRQLIIALYHLVNNRISWMDLVFVTKRFGITEEIVYGSLFSESISKPELTKEDIE